jgi:hypothetical protein
MWHVFALVVGDHTRSGHGRTKTFLARSSISPNALQKAYLDGLERLGMPFDEDYQDEGHWTVTKEVYRGLLSLGWKPPRNFQPEKTYLTPKLFARIVLFLCRVGSPSLRVTFLKTPSEEVPIGGYSLLELP